MKNPKTILMYKILLIIVLVASQFVIGINISKAHPVLPQEVEDYLAKNPDMSGEEFDNLLKDLYGQEFLDDFYDTGKSETDIKKIKEDAELILSTKTQEKTFIQDATDFISLGFEHIIKGLDHVLFVLSIVLILLPWKKIIKMVTTFTVAHSLTLILAGSGLLTLSSKIVEPIIALSIAYMAITTVFLKKFSFFGKTHNKIIVVFLFGLFHGLGFASVFTDLNISPQNFISSLLLFNIGVEFGQIAILILAVPALEILSKNKKVYNIFTKTFAIIISVVALFWFVTRIF